MGRKNPLAARDSWRGAKSTARQRIPVLLFVYGTLTEPERAAAVLDDWAYEGEAELSGLHRVDGEYPTLAPGGRVSGRLLRTDEVDRLDAYEGTERGLYVRGAVPLADDDEPGGHASVEVYVGDPDQLGAPVEWPGDGDLHARVRDYLDANDVAVWR
jgi:gamma-glutamylcyclotransferase (GGCT)/AIG2-like uncharacterized protein YtfP